MQLMKALARALGVQMEVIAVTIATVPVVIIWTPQKFAVRAPISVKDVRRVIVWKCV